MTSSRRLIDRAPRPTGFWRHSKQEMNRWLRNRAGALTWNLPTGNSNPATPHLTSPLCHCQRPQNRRVNARGLNLATDPTWLGCPSAMPTLREPSTRTYSPLGKTLYRRLGLEEGSLDPFTWLSFQKVRTSFIAALSEEHPEKRHPPRTRRSPELRASFTPGGTHGRKTGKWHKRWRSFPD